jgi:hypothetical protein
MTIPEFFNIYRPTTYCDGTIAFQVHQNPFFIWMHGSCSNNKYKDQEFFNVLGEWESLSTEVLPKDQIVLREWRPLENDWKEHPELTQAERAKVAEMITFSRLPMNIRKSTLITSSPMPTCRSISGINYPRARSSSIRKGNLRRKLSKVKSGLLYQEALWRESPKTRRLLNLLQSRLSNFPC